MYGINTNVISLTAQRSLANLGPRLDVSMRRLVSGERINSATDDSAGLAVSARFTAQIRGLNQAIRNINDGISMAQVAESSMTEVTNNLQRIRDLAMQAANANYTTSDRRVMQKEASALKAEIVRIARSTDFNKAKLLASAATQTFQIGANKGDSFDAGISDITASGWRPAGAVGSGTLDKVIKNVMLYDPTRGQEVARSSLVLIDNALDAISSERGRYGVMMTQLESAQRDLQVRTDSYQASRSRILDTDFAEESAQLVRNQILKQSGLSMLAQANAQQQVVLMFLR